MSHYIVERRDTNRLNWVVMDDECKELKCDITRLFKNTEYLFRVRGVNKYGSGVLLQSEPMVARNTFSKLLWNPTSYNGFWPRIKKYVYSARAPANFC